jgi:hypothetical protein
MFWRFWERVKETSTAHFKQLFDVLQVLLLVSDAIADEKVFFFCLKQIVSFKG